MDILRFECDFTGSIYLQKESSIDLEKEKQVQHCFLYKFDINIWRECNKK